MSCMKRYLEDKCEEIANKTDVPYDHVFDIAMDMMEEYGEINFLLLRIICEMERAVVNGPRPKGEKV